jgi:hypothetical protein
MTEEDDFGIIANEIIAKCGEIFATRPYIAIVDVLGNIYYFDRGISSHLSFIYDFIKRNSYIMEVGGHSFPIGGINLGFFKISGNSIAVLYTRKGAIGQLLGFKSQYYKWADRISKLIGDVEEEPEILQKSKKHEIMREPKKFVKKFPVLEKKLNGREKFSLEVAKVFQFCDGKHSTDDISSKTGLSSITIAKIIHTYKNKKWIKIRTFIT